MWGFNGEDVKCNDESLGKGSTISGKRFTFYECVFKVLWKHYYILLV